LFPDSPTNAWFLTHDERAKAVQRIKVHTLNKLISALDLPLAQENQTGVENKHFKMEQYVLDVIVLFHSSPQRL
jgi:ACS family allantoate permease-like MFS transporter